MTQFCQHNIILKFHNFETKISRLKFHEFSCLTFHLECWEHARNCKRSDFGRIEKMACSGSTCDLALRSPLLRPRFQRRGSSGEQSHSPSFAVFDENRSDEALVNKDGCWAYDSAMALLHFCPATSAKPGLGPIPSHVANPPFACASTAQNRASLGGTSTRLLSLSYVELTLDCEQD